MAFPRTAVAVLPCCSCVGSKTTVERAHTTPLSPSRTPLPTFIGLRVSSLARSAVCAVPARSVPASRGIVCEQQQDTVSGAVEVTKPTWRKLVLDSEVPVLVDFWAPWCGPCRMIAPIIDELARKYSGRMRCLKLNTDENPDLATEYGVKSIPTVMVFTRGGKKDTVIGAVPKSTLTSTIEKYLD